MKKNIPTLVPIDFRQLMPGKMGIIDNMDGFLFPVKRIFWHNNILQGSIRGKHAHKTSKQVLICLSGSIDVRLEDEKGERSFFTLSKSDQGLYVPPMYWSEIIFGHNTIILTLASDAYDESDYIRDHKKFKKEADGI